MIVLYDEMLRHYHLDIRLSKVSDFRRCFIVVSFDFGSPLAGKLSQNLSEKLGTQHLQQNIRVTHNLDLAMRLRL